MAACSWGNISAIRQTEDSTLSIPWLTCLDLNHQYNQFKEKHDMHLDLLLNLMAQGVTPLQQAGQWFKCLVDTEHRDLKNHIELCTENHKNINSGN